MRTEARSLEALLEVLSQRIHDSRSELTMISQHLMQLGDQATEQARRNHARIRHQQRATAAGMARRSTAPPNRRATTSRSCSTTCRAPRQTARAWPSSCARSAASRAGTAPPLRRDRYRQPGRANERGGSAGSCESAERLADRLAEIEAAGAAAAVARSAKRKPASRARSTPCSTARPPRSRKSARGSTPRRRRSTALVEQASAGIGKAGAERVRGACRQHRARRTARSTACRAASPSRTRLAAHDRRDRSRPGADRRALHASSPRTATSAPTISSNRSPAPGPSSTRSPPQAGTQDGAIGVARRTHRRAAREHRAAGRRDPRRCRERDRRGAGRRRPARRRPPRRDQAGDRLDARRGGRSERPAWRPPATADRRAAGPVRGACSPSVDDGVEARPVPSSPNSPRRSVKVEREATSLSAETGPALVAALVQVKEAAAPCRRTRARGDRERSSRKARASCPTKRAKRSKRVIRESVEERLREVENVAARAVEFGARGVGPPDPADADARPERRRARSAYRADRQGAAREGQRGLRPARRRC